MWYSLYWGLGYGITLGVTLVKVVLLACLIMVGGFLIAQILKVRDASV